MTAVCPEPPTAITYPFPKHFKTAAAAFVRARRRKQTHPDKKKWLQGVGEVDLS